MQALTEQGMAGMGRSDSPMDRTTLRRAIRRRRRSSRWRRSRPATAEYTRVTSATSPITPLAWLRRWNEVITSRERRSFLGSSRTQGARASRVGTLEHIVQRIEQAREQGCRSTPTSIVARRRERALSVRWCRGGHSSEAIRRSGVDR